jgi:hypothetical protein
MTNLIVAGGSGNNGRVSTRGKDDQPLAEMIAADTEAVVAAGQKGGRPGRLTLYDGTGRNTINITSANAHAVIGGSVNGRVTAAGRDGQPLAELIAGETEAIIAAGQRGGRPARLTLYDGNGTATVSLTATNAHAVVGGGSAGRITAAGKDGRPVAELIATDKEGIIAAGQVGRPARVSLYDGTQKETIRLDAAAGDIVLYNADCAEEFDAADEVFPGAVVVLADDGAVRNCREPYDSRVLGVVSGADGYRTGILLDRHETGRLRVPVSLMGKVMCRVDAQSVPVCTGDLLTTSASPGHAMRADRHRAFGAVVGKALAPLPSGSGLIPVVVALQ